MESSENPLSADVYFIKATNDTYIVDVGSNEDAREAITAIPSGKIIITHFHQDHMENLKHIPVVEANLYVGDYTRKVLGYGTLVREQVHIQDGISIRILPIPNSHAKGSLCVLANEEYLLLGDSFYTNKNGYNVSLLYDEIKLLKELNFRYALMSHDTKVYTRDEILETLEYYYLRREKNNPYIPLST